MPACFPTASRPANWEALHAKYAAIIGLTRGSNSRTPLDVCEHDPARRAGDHRPLLCRAESVLAGFPRPHRGSRSGNQAAAAAQSAVPEGDHALSPARSRQSASAGESGMVGAVYGQKSRPHRPGVGALVFAGPEHLWDRNFHAHRPGDDYRRRYRASAQHRRAHSGRHSGNPRGGIHRSAADRGHCLCRGAGRQGGPHPPASHGLYRLRRRPAARRAVAAPGRNAFHGAAVCRLHAVQLHDQYRAQCDDLSDRGRGISDFHARSGRRLCCIVCQDRRGAHRVPVPDSAQGHRHATAAVDPGRNEPARRSSYAPLRHRNQGDQPGED